MTKPAAQQTLPTQPAASPGQTGAAPPSAPAQTPAAPAPASPGATAFADLLDRPVTYKPFLGSDGDEIVLTPRIVMEYLARPTKSGKRPSQADLVRFIRLCQARALNPWEGDAFLVGYDTDDGPQFNLITAHQAFVKRAEVHPEYDGIESGVTVLDKDGNLTDIVGDYVPVGMTLVAGWARVHFKHRKIPSYQRVALSTYHTGMSRWKKDPAGMISKVAEAHALRMAFPTKLGGLYLSEEFSPEQNLELERLPSGGKSKSEQLAEQMRARGAQAPEPPANGNGNGNGNGHEPSQPAEPAGAAVSAGATREPGEEG